MQHSSLNYDKVMKPVTRAMDALKRDKELRRSSLMKQLDNLASAADDVAEFTSVVDEDSYEKKVKLLQKLQNKCADAIAEVKQLTNKSGANPAVEELISPLA